MSTNQTILKGVIRGRTIQLDQEPGLPEGQAVAVLVLPVQPNDQRLPPGEGIRRSAGAWADDAEELDSFLEWNRQQRKIGRGEIDL